MLLKESVLDCVNKCVLFHSMRGSIDRRCVYVHVQYAAWDWEACEVWNCAQYPLLLVVM